jgi:hypothetical protein
MSIHEIRPQFTQDGIPSPKLKVDAGILRKGIQLLLNDILVGRNIAVDVSVRDTLSPRNEWRICIPPKEQDIYRAISNILAVKDAVYSAHIRRGTMQPREFQVNIWCRGKNEPAIVGSTD